MFENLFTPGKIGEISVRNRIVMPAMAHSCAPDMDGFATDATRDYYEARAKGGAGLIVVGSCAVSWPVGISGKPRLTIHDDRYINGLSKVVEAIHKHDAKAAIQLQHAGPAAQKNIIGVQPIAASKVSDRSDYAFPVYDLPRELSVNEIPKIVEEFSAAAMRAKEAGFDGLEIHAGHRYLINSFLSPFYNRRNDEYGGELNNRLKFLLEVLSAIKETVGTNFPVWTRINGEERDVNGGITIKEAKMIAKATENAGNCAIHISVYPNRHTGYPPSFALKLASSVKQGVNFPVIAVGRLSPEISERSLRAKKIDYVAFGRSLLVDPELPNKLASGQRSSIRPCLYCNTCLGRDPSQFTDIAVCTMNPFLGIEQEYAFKHAKTKKKILIIGGGPSGLEAARVAAIRGHDVTIIEEKPRLGGSLLLASMLRDENTPLIKYYNDQMKKSGVKLRLGKRISESIIRELGPDIVILAMGAKTVLPDIPGIKGANVFTFSILSEINEANWQNKIVFWLKSKLLPTGIRLLYLIGPKKTKKLLNLYMPFGNKILIVGAGLAGFEIANFLVSRKKQVVIVDKKGRLGMNDPPMPTLRLHLENILIEKGISIMYNIKSYDEITNNSIRLIDEYGIPRNIRCDTILFISEFEPNRSLKEDFFRKWKQKLKIIRIGDCVEPCGIREAIGDGIRVGAEI